MLRLQLWAHLLSTSTRKRNKQIRFDREHAEKIESWQRRACNGEDRVRDRNTAFCGGHFPLFVGNGGAYPWDWNCGTADFGDRVCGAQEKMREIGVGGGLVFPRRRRI